VEPKSKTTTAAAAVLSKHVVLQLESIDRMYFNVIVRRLQILQGPLRFIRQQRKAKVFFTKAVEPMTRAFVQAIEQFNQGESDSSGDLPKRTAQG
jgi:hypothetical protein